MDNSSQVQHRVLVIEPDTDKRLLRTKYLQPQYLAREASDTQSGWEILLLDQSIHAVLTNLCITQNAELDLIQRIRNSKIRRIRTIPILLVIPAPKDANNIDEATQQGISNALNAGANSIVYEISSSTELQAQIQTQITAASTHKALEEARETAARTATLDPVTHLPTPHFLEMQLEISWAYAKRHKSDLAILYIRIDRDKLGQHANNSLWFIKLENALSELLSKTIRKEDVIARTAEGEFCVVAIGINHTTAHHFAERICRAIAQSKVQSPSGPIATTLSIGLATLIEDDSHTIFELRATARERVELAQKNGGDRVLSNTIASDHRNQSHTPQRQQKNSVPVTAIKLEQAIKHVNDGQIELVIPHLPTLQAELLPLLLLLKEFDLLP